MKDHIVIHQVSSFPEWEDLFPIILMTCDAFEICFPLECIEPESPVMTGKEEFEELTGVHVETYEDYLKINGKLEDYIKNLFYLFTEPSFDGNTPLLWNFKLLKKKEIYLSIENFSLCKVILNQDLMKILEKNEVKLSLSII